MFNDLINRSQQMAEQDFRLLMLNSLLRTPHRQVEPFIPLFKHVHDRDPLFFGHLGAWYCDHGSVRDLKQLFVAFLCASDFSAEYRSAGSALLQKMAPFEVQRVIGMIKGRTVNGAYSAGIAGSVPRSVKTAVEQYLRNREANEEAFDRAVLHARKPLKTLYASLRIKPGRYAQRVLFDNDPPAGSCLIVLKKLAASNDPLEQAELIAEHKIPYRVAVSALKQMTPAVLAALVSVMTPQEVINNLSSLKKRGVVCNDELRQLIENKLEQAKTDTRVSALKTRQAVKAANLDDALARKVEAVGDAKIQAIATIKRATALLVDKSGSMEQAIEVGKQIAGIIAPVCEAGLFVYAFDAIAYQIFAGGTQLSDWERAFKGIAAGGNTSCGVAVEIMRRNKQIVEQIVMVTDQGENSAPYLQNAMVAYAEEFGVMPSVVIVNVGRHSDDLVRSLGAANISVDTFDFEGDYYSLPSLLPMLAHATRLDLLMEIMNYPLPQRKTEQLAAAG